MLVRLLSLLAYANGTQEQQIERLIKQLQDADSDVRLMRHIKGNRIKNKEFLITGIAYLES